MSGTALLGAGATVKAVPLATADGVLAAPASAFEALVAVAGGFVDSVAGAFVVETPLESALSVAPACLSLAVFAGEGVATLALSVSGF
jgi:hypothetical protein